MFMTKLPYSLICRQMITVAAKRFHIFLVITIHIYFFVNAMSEKPSSLWNWNESRKDCLLPYSIGPTDISIPYNALGTGSVHVNIL